MSEKLHTDKRSVALEKIEREATLLVGLLYHGKDQHDALVARNIFKDGLERAHTIFNLARKGNGRKPL